MHTKVKVFIRSTKSAYSSVNGSFDFSGLSALSPVNFSYLHSAKFPVRAERCEVRERKQAGAPTSTYFLAMTSVRLTISAKLMILESLTRTPSGNYRAEESQLRRALRPHAERGRRQFLVPLQ